MIGWYGLPLYWWSVQHSQGDTRYGERERCRVRWRPTSGGRRRMSWRNGDGVRTKGCSWARSGGSLPEAWWGTSPLYGRSEARSHPLLFPLLDLAMAHLPIVIHICTHLYVLLCVYTLKSLVSLFFLRYLVWKLDQERYVIISLYLFILYSSVIVRIFSFYNHVEYEWIQCTQDCDGSAKGSR